MRGDSKVKGSRENSSLWPEQKTELPDEKFVTSQNAAIIITEMSFKFYVSTM
jgi:hypothetical protein